MHLTAKFVISLLMFSFFIFVVFYKLFLVCIEQKIKKKIDGKYFLRLY